MLRFFTSIQTAIIFLGVTILFFFAGCLIIPRTMELYTNIIDTVLFVWIPQEPLSATWWIVGLVLSLGLLTINTLVCSADVLIRRWGKKDLLRLLSPQVVHLGVLLILMGHFLTSVAGLRGEAVLHEGDTYQITERTAFRVADIAVTPSERTGVSWDVHGTWIENGQEAGEASVRPAAPAYHKGLWLVIRSADTSPELQTILMARRDPGVAWAGAGALLFVLGCLMLVVTREREQG